VLGLAVIMAVTRPFGLYATAGLEVRLVYFVTTAVLIWLRCRTLLLCGRGLPALVSRGAHGAGRGPGGHTGHRQDHRPA
jgi:hypothetical protein